MKIGKKRVDFGLGFKQLLALFMRSTIFLAIFCGLSIFSKAQKPFVGSLEYNISTVDYVMKDTIDGKLFIYARDSIVRINYLFADGKSQETIHHLEKRKLLSLIEVNGQFMAIQIKDTTRNEQVCVIHKNLNWERIAGVRCREANAVFKMGNFPLFYYKNIPARYFVGFNSAPGLPVKGKIPTENGYMAFELQKIDERTPPQSLFIPDKKYKIMSLDAFLQWSNGQ
jgi:hypothetical protein